MAYFGRKPKKPQSVPGAASGGREGDMSARLRSIGRQLARGRQGRPVKAVRSTRAQRGKR